jgi:hypothetical protein
MKTIKQLREKKLTPAEKKKREEIAKAMEKDNPNMPMDKKMAIATAQAKKVAEGKNLDEISAKLARKAAASSAAKNFEYGSSAYGPDADKEMDRLDKKADKARAHVQKRQGDKGVKKVDRMTGKLIYGRNESVAESAKGRAFKDMSRDKDFQRKDDEDDIRATDDDRKAADKNIVMQIRSAADLPKGGTIEFKDGKKTKLTQQVAKQIVDKFNSIQKPMDKKKFQDMAGASLNGLKQAIRIK